MLWLRGSLWWANFHHKCILGHLDSALAGVQRALFWFLDEYPAQAELLLKKLEHAFSIS